jgi:hypothetical protein
MPIDPLPSDRPAPTPLAETPFQRAHVLEGQQRQRDTRHERLRALWRDLPADELLADLALLGALLSRAR